MDKKAKKRLEILRTKVTHLKQQLAGATKQMDMGRVFMFADEWVTYTSQWDGTGADTCAMDPAHNFCTNRLAPQYYQVPQFWYNAIKWASGDRECFDFDADVPIVR